jgi:glycolate oxidase iron-sulfur subunit
LETHLADFIKDTAEGREAEAILRTCVHCGFCTATCPTYQLLGDELDGPRGRIYLIKQMLEGSVVTAKTQLHLDRCLTCRACETTCPSGVRYGRLVDIGRHLVEERVPRPARDRARRWLLRKGLLSRPLLALAIVTGRAAWPLLPRSLAQKLPPARAAARGRRRGMRGRCSPCTAACNRRWRPRSMRRWPVFSIASGSRLSASRAPAAVVRSAITSRHPPRRTA